MSLWTTKGVCDVKITSSNRVCLCVDYIYVDDVVSRVMEYVMLTFKFVESNDPLVEDDQYECVEHSQFSIQCLTYPIGADRFVVNEYEYENDKLQSVKDHGSFVYLQSAKDKITELTNGI